MPLLGVNKRPPPSSLSMLLFQLANSSFVEKEEAENRPGKERKNNALNLMATTRTFGEA